MRMKNGSLKTDQSATIILTMRNYTVRILFVNRMVLLHIALHSLYATESRAKLKDRQLSCIVLDAFK